MNDQIPKDLRDFYESGRRLEYDPKKCAVGKVELYDLQSIKLVDFEVNSQHWAPWAAEDPHADEVGYYIVPALDLISKCEHYSPGGVLIYIPQLGVYGSFDDDHRTITYFPKIKFWSIVGDPVKYLSAQWRPKQSDFNPILNPVGLFPFQPGWNW